VAKLKRDMTGEEAEREIARLYKLVDMDPPRMKNYPHQYSGGMKQRAIIAMSFICRPTLIIADEPTTALDVVVQDRILRTLKDLQKSFGLSTVTISHDISVIATTCDKLAVMYGGKIFEFGSTSDVLNKPNNPYTRALVDCSPDIHNPKAKLKGIPGEPPDLRAPARGCRFAPRCALAKDVCRDQSPPLHEPGPGRLSLCHFAKELAS
jgi:peptide/nickel transport system ATP-binding protein